MLAGIGAAAAVAAVLIAVAVVREGDSSSVPADPTTITGSPVSTAASVATTPPTAASTSASAPASTASTSPAVVTPTDFDRTCVDRTGVVPTATPVDPLASFGTFGPLQTAAALSIELPGVRTPPSVIGSSAPPIQPPVSATTVIPGGVLVTATAAIEAGGPHGSLLAAVNLDGSVRWVRCLRDDLGAAALVQTGPGASTAVVSVVRDGVVAGWQAFALDDGRSLGSLSDVARGDGGAELVRANASVLAVSDTVALLGPTHEATAGPPRLDGDGGLVLLDLATLEATVVPFPQVAGASLVSDLGYAVDDGGRPVVLAPGAEFGPPVLVLIGGTWVEGAAANAGSTFVSFGVAMGAPVQGRDAAGDTVWTNAGITRYGGEGAQWRAAGDVTVVRGCIQRGEDGTSCVTTATSGVSNADGRVLWQIPGDHILGPAGDGYALIGTGPGPDGTGAGWFMIDLATGSEIPGQRWDGEDTFGQGCCASWELHTERHGGVVVATTGQLIRVYVPTAAGVPPATAVLP